jgi:hypothetical protein
MNNPLPPDLRQLSAELTARDKELREAQRLHRAQITAAEREQLAKILKWGEAVAKAAVAAEVPTDVTLVDVSTSRRLFGRAYVNKTLRGRGWKVVAREHSWDQDAGSKSSSSGMAYATEGVLLTVSGKLAAFKKSGRAHEPSELSLGENSAVYGDGMGGRMVVFLEENTYPFPNLVKNLYNPGLGNGVRGLAAIEEGLARFVLSNNLDT